MPLVYAGVVPHAPLLLPTVAKSHRNLLTVTVQQLELMAQEIHARQVEILIILTPHGQVVPGAISINVADSYRGRLTEFGDIRTDLTIFGKPAVIHQIKTAAESAEVPIVLQTNDLLDYGTAVPLKILSNSENKYKVIPICLAGQPVSSLLRFGAVLHEYFQTSTERIGLIASSDLDRRSTKKSKKSGPVEYDQRPTRMEKKLATAITQLDPSIIADLKVDSNVCGYNPILVLLASLQPTTAHGRMTSFEAPFGVGQMTATVDLLS